MYYKTATGIQGENEAVHYLKKKGYKILHCNWRQGIAEIDIIAEHKGVTVFIEVKTRSSLKYGYPSESVMKNQQRRYVLTAQQYIIANRLYNKDIRFDVIEVLGDEINHIEDAFRA